MLILGELKSEVKQNCALKFIQFHAWLKFNDQYMTLFQSGVELFQYALIGEEEMTVMMSQCQWQGGEGPDKQEELTLSQSVRGKH